MAKYKKLPIEIDAIIWDGENVKEVIEFFGKPLTDAGEKKFYFDYSKSPVELKIKTLEGDMAASVGDYVIQGVAGEFYPCKPEIFKKTYEIVERRKNANN